MATLGALPIAAAQSLGQQCVVSRLVGAGSRSRLVREAQSSMCSHFRDPFFWCKCTAGAASAAILIQTASHGGCDTCVPLLLRSEEKMLLRTPPGTPPPWQQWQFLSSRHYALLVESSQVQGGSRIEDVASTCLCCSRELRKFQQDDPIHEIARQCLQQQLQVHGKQQMGSFHVLRRRQEQGSGASLSSETTCDSHGHGPLQAASTESHRRQSFST